MGTSKKLQRRQKNREARRKGRTFKKKPPLWVWDRVIYWCFILLPIILCVAGLVRMAVDRGKSWETPGLIALATPVRGLAVAVGMLLPFASALACVGLKARQPLFGIPGFCYGREGGMKTEMAPLFRKAPSRAAAFHQWLYGLLMAVIVTMILIPCIAFPRVMADRWEFYDREIRHITYRVDSECVYTWADVDAYEIRTESTGGKSHTYFVEVRFSMTDGKQVAVSAAGFRDIDTLAAVDAILRGMGTERGTYVNEEWWGKICRRQSYTPEELEVLAELLGMQ